VIERSDLPLGPRFEPGGDAASLEMILAEHALGRASISDALRDDGAALAATWATPELLVFPIRTPTLAPATHTNAIFVVSDGDAVLIEPASPYQDEIARVLAAVEELARRGVRVREIWATHHHVDHVGGALALTEALRLPLRAHPETLTRLDPDIAHGAAIIEGDHLRVGGITLEAMHVPGHALGHLAFLEPRLRAVIAGDMVAAVGTILIEPDGGDMAQYLDSLRRLVALDAVVVLPAHGGSIRPGRAIFERYIAHRLAREAKVLAALEAEPRSLETLVARAYSDAPPAIWPLALLSLEAHLIKLEHDERAVRGALGWALRT